MKNYLIGLVVLIVTFLAGYYSKPAKVEVKEVIKEKLIVDKHSTGTVREREFKDKDGSVKIVRRIKYDNKESTKSEVTKESSKIETNIPNNMVTLRHKFGREPDITRRIGLEYQRRLFGTVYIGGYIQRDVNVNGGLSISLGF